MKVVPPRDSLDFVAALALGAVIGWSVTVMVRAEEEPAHPRRRLPLPRLRKTPEPEPPFLQNLRGELGRLAREAGEQLTESAIRRLGQRFLGTGSKVER